MQWWLVHFWRTQLASSALHCRSRIQRYTRWSMPLWPFQSCSGFLHIFGKQLQLVRNCKKNTQGDKKNKNEKHTNNNRNNKKNRLCTTLSLMWCVKYQLTPIPALIFDQLMVMYPSRSERFCSCKNPQACISSWMAVPILVIQPGVCKFTSYSSWK